MFCYNARFSDTTDVDAFHAILARWLLLLGMVDARKKKVYEEIYYELEELAMKDENLLEAFNVWENLSQSQESILAYQSRLKHIIDEEAKMADTKFLAEKEKAISVAKVLLNNNIDPLIIMESTGLSEKELEEVRKLMDLEK